MIAKDEGDDEEGYSKENSNPCDDVDEVGNFLGNGSISGVKPRSQTSNATHDRVVTDVHHNSPGSALNSVGGEEGEVLGFQGILVGVLRAP